MTERGERVLFTAAAAFGTAAVVGGVALTLINRHRENGDVVKVEGIDPKLAEELGVIDVIPSDEITDAEVVYVGSISDLARSEAALEVHAIVDIQLGDKVDDIGDDKKFRQLARWAINGCVYIRNLVSHEDDHARG